MKSNSNINNASQNKNFPTHGPVNKNNNRPEIRDNLDSREGEEQETKGNDITHNKKETKEKHLKQKN